MTPPPLDPFALVGTTLAGKYAVERVVAETELSVVYRASHRVWHRPVAIKAFKAAMVRETAREQLLESFVREGALLMDLSERCAAICQARDVGSTITATGEWVPYMVLEWLEGEPLDVVLARERGANAAARTVEQALRLLEPVARALSLAHERHIVHGDVKPANVFLLAEAAGDGSRCKLLDFGIAKVLDEPGTRTPADENAGDEAIMARSFTPAYAAPEQFDSAHGPTGPWTDVFALALLFVETIAGREPLEGPTVESLAERSCDAANRPTPRSLGAAVSDEVELVIARALAVRPADRYANARDFWLALSSAAFKADARRAPGRGRAKRAAPEFTATIPMALMRKRSAAKRRWLVPAVAIVGAAAGIGTLRLGPWPAASRAEAWARLEALPSIVIAHVTSASALAARRH